MRFSFRRGLVLLLLCCVTAASARTFEGVVTHVTDGDSLWVRPAGGGKPQRLRLQGIDAPEACQPHGPQASAALAARVLHQRVRVDTRGRDDYDRSLARVRHRREDVGEWMVRQGHAWSYRFRHDAGPYPAQEAQARLARRGLWAAGHPMRPRDFRRRHGSCHR